MIIYECDQTGEKIDGSSPTVMANVMFSANNVQPDEQAMKMMQTIGNKHFSSLNAMAEWIKTNCKGM